MPISTPPISPQPTFREGPKYKAVWQRLRLKVRTKLYFDRLSKEIHLYGASTMGGSAPDNDMLMLRKLAAADTVGEVSRVKRTYLCIPGSKVKTGWSGLYLVLMFYTAFVMPYRMAFGEEEEGQGWMDVGIDGLFFVDILVRLNSAYVNSLGTIVTNRKVILLRYLKTWFCIDFIACFPFFLFQDDSSDSTEQSTSKYRVFLRLLRIPRLYRLLRISRVFRFARHYREYDCLERLQSHITPSSIRLIAFSLSVLFGVHLMTCAWYFTARVEGLGPETWVVHCGLQDKTAGDAYIASLYWTITTLATVGYGDIIPTTSMERIVAVIWMLVGVSFYSLMVSSLANFLHNLNSKSSVLSNKLAAIDEFASEAKLSKDLRARLKHAIRYTALQTSFTSADKRSTFNELPRELRYEIAVVMHNGAAKSIPFFMEKDQVFVAAIVPLLHCVYKQVGSVVYEQGEYAEEIYFIVSGRCVVLMDAKHVLKRLQKGSYFGEVELIEQIPRKFTVKTSCDSELLTLSKRVLMIIKSEFPFIYTEMTDLATIRDQLNAKTHAHFVKLLSAGSQEGSIVGSSADFEGKYRRIPTIPRGESYKTSKNAVIDVETRLNQVKSDFESINSSLKEVCEVLSIPCFPS